MTKEAETPTTKGEPALANEPGYKPQGDVMIEIPIDHVWDEQMDSLVTSLESRGWNVHHRYVIGSSSMEDSSDGQQTGRPVIGNATDTNSIINGVVLPTVDETNTYRVVQIVRPEDTVKGGESGLLYLMNGVGGVKEYMKNEGFLIVDDEDALHTALVEKDGA